jgi:hypothetical protein
MVSRDTETEDTSTSVVPRGTGVGDTFALGSYSGQDIVWQVLAIEDGKALVITRDIIDLRAYNEELVDMTWEACTLRTWLNDDFRNSAFTDKERGAIALTRLSNPDNPEYGIDGGADTEDYVFLLSIDDAERYFDSEDARVASLNLTDELIDDAAHRIDENPYYGDSYTFSEAREDIADWNDSAYGWWSRSPGIHAERVAGFDDGGVDEVAGARAYDDGIGVRPALWLNL